MCLDTIYDDNPYGANDNLVGYKVVVKINKKYFARYQDCIYEIGKSYDSRNVNGRCERQDKDYICGFHVWDTLDAAKIDMISGFEGPTSNLVILQVRLSNVVAIGTNYIGAGISGECTVGTKMEIISEVPISE